MCRLTTRGHPPLNELEICIWMHLSCSEQMLHPSRGHSLSLLLRAK